ncbi:hypothetical protein PV04_07704 [Phialophora macrospora]|uniref:ABM domain-containing protein n=1 Tax=Phialophora macrospora TaxID=1851006 RepID=A0A0D2FF42_9EURO|nr:hypothetical protein PV04_07704 [Phialophora macrospora]
MPLIEIATVRLHPSFSSNVPDSFTSTWIRACNLATEAANGVSFQLYHAVASTDQDLYYLVGGWQTGDDHIKFLSTPDAVTVAKSIGQYVTVDVVRHIDGDVGLLGSTAGRPKKLTVTVYKIPESDVADWESKWESSHQGPGGAGGWDLSAVVQNQHRAFRQMGEATNSVSAFGGKDAGGDRTWIWVESGEKSPAVADAQNVEAEMFEMEYVLG